MATKTSGMALRDEEQNNLEKRLTEEKKKN